MSNTKAPEKDIISFNQALELYIIGFNEPTFCMYEIENRQLCLCHLDEEGLYIPDKDLHAPTKGQVFRWFRDVCDMSVYITRHLNFVDDNTKWKPVIDNMYYPKLAFKTYEEAENSAIDELIELVKQQGR